MFMNAIGIVVSLVETLLAACLNFRNIRLVITFIQADNVDSLSLWAIHTGLRVAALR